MPAQTMTVEKLFDLVAESVGLDPAKLTNDPELASEWNQRKADTLKQLGVTDPATAQIRVDSAEDVPKMADLIQADTAALKEKREETNARAVSAEGNALRDPNGTQRIEPDLIDGAKIGGEMWEEYHRRQVRWTLGDYPMKSFGDLMTRPTTHPDIQRFQDANDDLMLAAALMGYRRDMGGNRGQCADVRRLKVWNDLYEPIFKSYVGKALDTTEASDWVPTSMSGNMVEQLYEATNVMALIPRIDFPMGIGTLDLPTEGADAHIYLTGEATADDGDAKITASTPGVGKVSLTAKTLASRIVTSQEMAEDSAVAIVPYMRTMMIRAFARDLDDAIVNGDTTATHHDGDVTSPTDWRKAFTGFVEKALTDTGANVDCSTYFNFESLIKPTILMEAYADDPNEVVFIVNRYTDIKIGTLKETRNILVYVTWQQLGRPGAAETGTTEMTGGTPMLNGYRVVQSSKVRRVVGASGVWASSNSTYSVGIWVNLPSWLMAVKREMGLVGLDRAEQLQRVLMGSWRGALQSVPATSSDVNTAICYGIPNGA